MYNISEEDNMRTQFRLSHLNLLVIALVMGSSYIESSARGPKAEGDTCGVTDEKGNIVTDKDGNPLMGKYRKKAQTADSSKAEPVAPPAGETFHRRS